MKLGAEANFVMLDALIRSVKELMDQKTTRERVGQIRKSIGIEFNHKYFNDYRDDFDKYIKSVNDGKLIKELEKLKKEQSEILEDLYLKKK